MKIGVNCLGINPRYKGGVNSFTFGLLDELVPLSAEHEIVIVSNTHNDHLFEGYEKHPSVVIKRFRIGWFEKFFDRVALVMLSKELYQKAQGIVFSGMTKAIDESVDIVYVPTAVMFPLQYDKPVVHSMHDIQHVHYPEFFSCLTKIYRNVVYPLSAECASVTQASSEFIKGDFLSCFDFLDDSEVEVIPEGVNLNEFRDFEGTSLEKYSLPSKFLFYPGQLWHHKDHITVLRALKILRDKHALIIPLVMTGARYSASETIFEYIEENLKGQIYYLGEVSFDEIRSLYKAATFLVTAVLYESSSIPILEAAASGTPVVASKTAPNEELALRLRLNLFEPRDASSLAKTLSLVWGDTRLQQSQVSANDDAIEYYSWRNAAMKYLSLFARLVSR